MHGRFAILVMVAAMVAALAGCAQPFHTAGGGRSGAATVEPFEVEVAGEAAHGLVGLPADPPTTLLVIAHPWSGTAEDYRQTLQEFADLGVLAVAMDFRGDKAAFKVRTGVEDTVAATLALQQAHPTVDRTLLYGYSMGGEIALLAVAAAPPGTFDHVFEGSGVTDLTSLWWSFAAARSSIEAETGGSPLAVPAEYTARSPVERVPDLMDRQVARYFIVHGAGDSPVPVEQAERLYKRMADAGLPVSFYMVTTNEEPWVCAPVVLVCLEGPAQGLANHEAGTLRLMRPLIDHRIERLPDPAPTPVRGTYDGDAMTYEPSDVGS